MMRMALLLRNIERLGNKDCTGNDRGPKAFLVTVPEIGIGEEPSRLSVRQSRPFRDAAKHVVHRPVQTREEGNNLFAAALIVIS